MMSSSEEKQTPKSASEFKEPDKVSEIEKSPMSSDENVSDAQQKEPLKSIDKEKTIAPEVNAPAPAPSPSIENTEEVKKSDNKNGKNINETENHAEVVGGSTTMTDARLGGFEIIGIKEKHGQLRKAVPMMPLPLAIVLCLFNVVLPGIGTLISSFTVFCGGKTEYDSKGKAFALNLIAALLQLITLPILVGWIWSIIWGVTFVTSSLSKDDANKEKQTIPSPEQV